MTTFLRSALVFGLLAMPAAAHAQATRLFVAPYAGGTFAAGGDLAKEGAATVGVSVGWMGGSWGLEGDIAETSGFFVQDGFRTDRRVSTMMGNVLFGVPLTSQANLKAYAAGGLGVIRPRLAEAGGLSSVDVKQGAFNVGAGVLWMKGAVGLRGDVRYFRGLGDEADDVNAFDLEVSALHFVRATVGVVVGF